LNQVILDYSLTTGYQLRQDIQESRLIPEQLAQNPRAIEWLETYPHLDTLLSTLSYNPFPDMKSFYLRHDLPLPSCYDMTPATFYHEQLWEAVQNQTLDLGEIAAYPRILEWKDRIINHPDCTVRFMHRCCFYEHSIYLLPYLIPRLGNITSEWCWSMLSKCNSTFDIGFFESDADPRIDWRLLCSNTHPTAMEWIQKNLTHPKLCWRLLSLNPSASSLLISLLDDPTDDRLHWAELSENPSTELLDAILRKQLTSYYVAMGCSRNTNPLMGELLTQLPRLKNVYSLIRNYEYDTLSLLDLKKIQEEEDEDFYPYLMGCISSHPFLFEPSMDARQEWNRIMDS